ncbi:MAG: hypothetical protein O3A51_06030 [Verrucomicrobia bacterium]|nr:hypothetical protein [Verrucomicrobiota bacterium]
MLEHKTQRLINSLDEGVGQMIVRFLAALLAIGLFGWAFTATQFHGLTRADAMEAAHVGRQLAAGQGYVTRCMRPIDVAYLAAVRPDLALTQAIPELHQAPAYPMVLSIIFRIVRPSFVPQSSFAAYRPEACVMIPFLWLLMLATAGMVFAVGRQLFGVRVGALAAVVTLIGARRMETVLSGSAMPLAIFFVTAGVALSLWSVRARKHQGSTLRWGSLALAAGLAMGAAALTAYSLCGASVVAILILAAGFQRGRRTALAMFAVGFLLLVLPWLHHNNTVTGSHFGLAPYVAVFGESHTEPDRYERSPVPEVRAQQALKRVETKIKTGLRDAFSRDLWLLGSGIGMAFFVVSLLLRFESDDANSLKWCLLCGVVTLMIASAVAGRPELLVVCEPLIILVGIAALFDLLQQQAFFDDGWQRALTGILILVVALPSLLAMGSWTPRSTYPPYAQPLIHYVDQVLEPDTILSTDIPWATAWYADRQSLLLPGTVAELQSLYTGGLAVGGLYLTTETGGQPYVGTLVDGHGASWLPLINRLVPDDFPWQHGVALPPDSRDQLLLTDGAVWEP